MKVAIDGVEYVPAAASALKRLLARAYCEIVGGGGRHSGRVQLRVWGLLCGATYRGQLDVVVAEATADLDQAERKRAPDLAPAEERILASVRAHDPVFGVTQGQLSEGLAMPARVVGEALDVLYKRGLVRPTWNGRRLWIAAGRAP